MNHESREEPGVYDALQPQPFAVAAELGQVVLQNLVLVTANVRRRREARGGAGPDVAWPQDTAIAGRAFVGALGVTGESLPWTDTPQRYYERFWRLRESVLFPAAAARLQSVEGAMSRAYKRHRVLGGGMAIVGSVAFGGLFGRAHACNFEETSDLDVIPLHNEDSLPEAARIALDKSLKTALKRSQVGMELRVCSSYDLTRRGYQNITSTPQALELLHGVYNKGSLMPRILAYFQHSLPEVVNEMNSTYMLEAFVELHRDAPAVWERVVADLSGAWQRYVHPLSLKHLFGYAYAAYHPAVLRLRPDLQTELAQKVESEFSMTADELKMAQQLVADANRLGYIVFRDVLLSTANA